MLSPPVDAQRLAREHTARFGRSRYSRMEHDGLDCRHHARRLHGLTLLSDHRPPPLLHVALQPRITLPGRRLRQHSESAAATATPSAPSARWFVRDACGLRVSLGLPAA